MTVKKANGKNRSYLRQSGSTFYRKAIRINGVKIEKSFSRKVDAEKWYADKKREKELVENGLDLPKTARLLNEFSAEWLEKRKQNGKPMSSWQMDEARLRLYIVPEFGGRPLQMISTREWESFLDGLVSKSKVSPATRNRIRSLATKLYNDAIRMEVVSVNPVRLVPKLKESMDAWDYWASSGEILTYLTLAQNECLEFWIFANLAVNTGARIGELLALDHSDVNLEQRRIHIAKVFEEKTGKVFNRTKANKDRWLGINDPLFEVLLECRNKSKFKKPGDAVICDSAGKRLYERRMRSIHERVCERAGIKAIRIHDLRHTYASHYIMNGGGLAELQSLLGHSSPMMTLKYAHLAPGFLESKAKVVSFGLPKNNVVTIRKAQ